ncbi:MAG: maleylpyruvate isomerase family mycothiol-dependent enzyme [Actinobacteria bacterium]|nr:maleylpyruvate isomerase family mycothiol-dependent enzyme [Actinomycetota bacterium]MCB9411583.1 maleylpyruvate isomerase family mycothiol-dependent enzyme [Actinomycetota bacterium]
MAPQLQLHEATYPQLIEAWLSAVEPFADLAESLSAEQWAAPSVLPGWSNADIVAHVVGIERDLLGDPTPSADLDWEQLPHADDLFSRYTELAVAMRRGVPQAEVTAELRKTIAARREALAEEPGALGDIVRGPGGWELPRGVVIRMRCFDIWVHDQDIRAGIGEPGDLGTPAAWVAADRMLSGLERTWARDVKAPAGATAEVTVTGPGVEFVAAVTADDNGRGRLIEPPAEPTVRLTMDWPTFVARSAGRAYPEIGSPRAEGDPELTERLLTNFNVAP